MLGNQSFKYNQLTQYMEIFGSLFTDIKVPRTDSNNSIIQHIVLPCSYAPKQKWMSALRQNLGQEEYVGIQVPSIQYEMKGMSRITDRQSYPLYRNFSTVNNYSAYTTFAGSSWRIGMSVYIIVKNAEDGFTILEQILPVFSPDISLTVNTMGPNLNYKDDVFVSLNSVIISDEYEGSLDDRRVLTYELEFIYDVKLYGIITQKGVIKDVTVNLYIPDGDIADAVGNSTPQVIMETSANTSNGVVITNTITENMND